MQSETKLQQCPYINGAKSMLNPQNKLLLLTNRTSNRTLPQFCFIYPSITVLLLLILIIFQILLSLSYQNLQLNTQ